MAITRLLLTKVEAKVNEEEKLSGGSVSVSTNSRVGPVVFEEIGGQKVLSMKWGLDVEYAPSVGKIVVEGKVYISGDIDKVTVKNGNTTVLVPDEARQVHQAILRLPLIVAINLAREVALPLPMNFPTVEVEEKSASGKKAKSS